MTKMNRNDIIFTQYVLHKLLYLQIYVTYV